MKRKFRIAALAALAAAVIGSAYAAKAEEDDAMAIANAKGVTLTLTIPDMHS